MAIWQMQCVYGGPGCLGFTGVTAEAANEPPSKYACSVCGPVQAAAQIAAQAAAAQAFGDALAALNAGTATPDQLALIAAKLG